ncbi:MAG TPA: methyltransferase domain-containing protein [Chloroflexota bacterium]|nr:methyltransferase domain-containing protein [Chloroflexota bacterium]
MRVPRIPSVRLSRTDEPELIDRSGHDPAVLAENLADIRQVNRWLGGTWLTIRALDHLTAGMPPGAAVSILDVATGSADLPEAIIAEARRRGLVVRLLATDVSEQILGLARCRVSTAMEFAVVDGRFLPFANDSFDVVTCSLVLHHLDPDAAVAMLREMSRVARRGIVVNDLVRSRIGYWGAWLLCHLLTSNPLTRHDGPLSVRRSYTYGEMTALAERAGLDHIVATGFLGYRVAISARRRPPTYSYAKRKTPRAKRDQGAPRSARIRKK